MLYKILEDLPVEVGRDASSLASRPEVVSTSKVHHDGMGLAYPDPRLLVEIVGQVGKVTAFADVELFLVPCRLVGDISEVTVRPKFVGDLKVFQYESDWMRITPRIPVPHNYFCRHDCLYLLVNFGVSCHSLTASDTWIICISCYITLVKQEKTTAQKIYLSIFLLDSKLYVFLHYNIISMISHLAT